MATAKQLAARKLFAARAKAGLLQGNKKKRAKKTAEHYERPGLISKVEAAEAALRIAKKHAARKANPAKKKAVTRPSNPASRKFTLYAVVAKKGGAWGDAGAHLAYFKSQDSAVKLATRHANKYSVPFSVDSFTTSDARVYQYAPD